MPVAPLATFSIIRLLSCTMRARAYSDPADPSDSNSTSARHTLREVLVAVAILTFLVAVFYVVDRWLEWDTESRFENGLNVVSGVAVRMYDGMCNHVKKLIAAMRHNGQGGAPPATGGELESATA